jgi:hypothetical protein
MGTGDAYLLSQTYHTVVSKEEEGSDCGHRISVTIAVCVATHLP